MMILNMTLSASLMILAVGILRRLTIHKLPKKTFCVLWAVVTARLLIPYSLPFRFSAYTGFARLLLAAFGSDNVENLLGSTKNLLNNADSPAAPVSGGYIHYTVILQFIWVAGAVAALVFFLVSYIKNRWKLQESLPVNSTRLADLVDEWRRHIHIRRRISLRESDRIHSPLTYGVLKPTILLPAGVSDSLSEKETIFILTHEMIHIKRFDIIWKFILTLAVCVHWFNPLVWIMYLLANQDIEMSCDETSIGLLGRTSRREYAMTLVRFAEIGTITPGPLACFSENSLKERVTSVMKNGNRTPLHIIMSGTLVVTLAFFFATSALLPQSTPSASGQNEQSEQAAWPNGSNEQSEQMVWLSGSNERNEQTAWRSESNGRNGLTKSKESDEPDEGDRPDAQTRLAGPNAQNVVLESPDSSADSGSVDDSNTLSASSFAASATDGLGSQNDSEMDAHQQVSSMSDAPSVNNNQTNLPASAVPSVQDTATDETVSTDDTNSEQTSDVSPPPSDGVHNADSSDILDPYPFSPSYSATDDETHSSSFASLNSYEKAQNHK